MGNLHAGHINLVRHARAIASRVVVSIFVNPMQFGETEDFDGYSKRTVEDCADVTERDVVIVYMGE